MGYTKIKEGYITERKLGTDTSTVSAPRCVTGTDGSIICTFNAQSELGINDFKPMISRSYDQGNTWTEAVFIWPSLALTYSIFGSISKNPLGGLLYYGTRTVIDTPGESFWSETTQGLKQNELVWAQSFDDGYSWSEFKTIPLPIAGSAEAPGPMWATQKGRLVCCYAPYNTFDPTVAVKKNQVISLLSDDNGLTWQHSPMIQFPYDDSIGAEAWVVELQDGSLLGTSWHIRPAGDVPNAYALSSDGGQTWSKTMSTGTLGQSTALTPLREGHVLFLYNQRKFGDIGVWMVLAKPTIHDFGIQLNRRVWAAEKAAQTGNSVEHDTWTDFAFGEPSALLLPNNEILVSVWVSREEGGAIAYTKLRVHDLTSLTSSAQR